MIFNLYILIIFDLLVSRTPLITVLSTEGLSWVNIPFIIISPRTLREISYCIWSCNERICLFDDSGRKRRVTSKKSNQNQALVCKLN